MTDLGEDMDPARLVEAAKPVSVLRAQRLGYLRQHAGAEDNTVLFKEHVRNRTRTYAQLLPAADAGGATRSRTWRRLVNADIVADA